jgi:maltooligosyltrehalose trehalohydrolase
VSYLENHDQVANSAFGRRLHQLAAPGRLRALTALTLLGPATPMLFQGQEFASSAPFLYFADHKKELRDPINRGRREFLEQFPSVTDPEVLAALPPAVDAIFRTDEALKSSGGDPRILLERLVVELCGPPKGGAHAGPGVRRGRL